MANLAFSHVFCFYLEAVTMHWLYIVFACYALIVFAEEHEQLKQRVNSLESERD
jgi:hypothetical protein